MSSFNFNDGTTASNLTEFIQSIKRIDENTFSHHVNESRNDFSNWIRDVLNNGEMAEAISNLKSKDEIIKKLEMKTDYGEKALNHLVKSNEEMVLALKHLFKMN